MERDNVTLNTKKGAVSCQLLYAHSFGMHPYVFDYLHQVRTRSLFQVAGREDPYWQSLETNRQRFAKGLPLPVDVLVDAPSNSGYHRPYFSAVAAKTRHKALVHFCKDTFVKSDPANIASLRASIKIFGVKPDLSSYISALIIDDVYSSGTIATVVSENLFDAGFPVNGAITIACPLRIDHDQPTLDDIESILNPEPATD